MANIDKIKVKNTTYNIVDSSVPSHVKNITLSDINNWDAKANTASPAFTGTPTAPTATAGTNTTLIATTAFVKTAIDNLPEPMVFKGSLGTGGTITSLPTNGTASVGDTYKVITDGTYASKSAKVGDTFICLTKTSNTNTWELIPSGDEPSGTVTSVGMTVPTGLSVSGSPVTSSGTLAVTYASGYSIPTTSKQSEWDSKQAALVGSGTGQNIKTVNNNNLVGSGNVSIATPGTLNTNNTSAQTVPASAEALSGTINLHKVSKTGTYSDLIGTPSLSTVATSGSYDDLSNKPTIPTIPSDWIYNASTRTTSVGMNGGNNTSVIISFADGLINFPGESSSYIDADEYTGRALESESTIMDALADTDLATNGATLIGYNDGNATTVAEALDSLNTALNGKLAALTFDSTPTASSTNPVTSGGVKSAIDAKVLLLIQSQKLSFYTIGAVSIDVYTRDDTLNGDYSNETPINTYSYAANTVVQLDIAEDEHFEINNTNETIKVIYSWPRTCNKFYNWFMTVNMFCNMVFNFNKMSHSAWEHSSTGSGYQFGVTEALYRNCVFWWDVAFSAPNTHCYMLHKTEECPLFYSTTSANTYKLLTEGYNVIVNPNWTNPDFLSSFSQAAGNVALSYTQVKSVPFGSSSDADITTNTITLPALCPGLMYASMAQDTATFDCTSTTDFGYGYSNWRGAFALCYELRNLMLKNLKTSIDLSWSPISNMSIDFIVSNASNSTPITIKVSSYTWYNLTNAIKTAATNKNITLTLDASHNVDLKIWNDASGFALSSDLNNKLDTLVSGTNIKTINNLSLLGSGNISISASGTETDPVFTASPAYGITANDISDWNAKQDALTFDNTPTANSDNPVKSSGIKNYVDNLLPIDLTPLFTQLAEAQAGDEESAVAFTSANLTLWNTAISLENYSGNALYRYGSFTLIPMDTGLNNRGWTAFGFPFGGMNETELWIWYIDDNGTTKYYLTYELKSIQKVLVSGTDIKTINGNSLLGSGNINTKELYLISTSNVTMLFMAALYHTISDLTAFNTLCEGILTAVKDGKIVVFNFVDGVDTTKYVSIRLNYYENTGENTTMLLVFMIQSTSIGILNFTKDYSTSNWSLLSSSVGLLPSVSGSGNAITGLSTIDGQFTLIKGSTFQEELVSGTNIKTINNTSLLGSGNISVLSSETDPVFTASAAYGISSSDITNWNSKTSNVGTVTGVKMNGTTNNPTSGVVDLGTVITSETALSKGTTSGNGNAVTDVSVSGHQITLTKGSTFLTEHQSIKTVNNNSLLGSGNVSVGTITSVKMNGSTVASSGEADLGRVVNDVTMNNTLVTISNGAIDLGTVVTSETALSKGTTTGNGNAVTDVSVSGHQITLTKGATFLTEHLTLKTINNESIVGTGNITISGGGGSGLPSVTTADNWKVLLVVNGDWAIVSPTILYTGSSTPSNSLGNNGDIYVQS